MKKIISLILSLAVASSFMVGCSSSSSTSTSTTTLSSESTTVDVVESDDGLKIVTSIFPIYDWTAEVLGEEFENVEMTLLLNSGVDLHSYEPSVEDIVKISEADLFIYVGGESDDWVDDVLATADNDDLVAISLTDILGDLVKAEESVEGMEESDHDHDENESDDHDHDEDEELEEDHDHDDEEVADEDEHDHDDEDDSTSTHSHDDEHVWLSLINAQVICDAIADLLSDLDSDNASVYTDNALAYNTLLSELSDEYVSVVADADYDTLLFADRFPFRYLVDDYGISYYAAFSGCSTESEASFETIVFLAEKIDELGLQTILVTESSDMSIADSVSINTSYSDQSILVLDSMQSSTLSDRDAGASYLSIMESNLEVIQSALTKIEY